MSHFTPGERAAPSRSISNLIGIGYYALAAELTATRDIMYEVSGRLFDAWHGVDTSGVVEIPDLIIPEAMRSQAARYQASKVSLFRHVLRQIALDDPERWAFVDFGCGKGRCLLLAAQAGFGEIVGIELAEPFCDAARRNAIDFHNGRYNSQIKITCANASTAALPSSPSVYFFYNPFGEQLMSATLHHIAAHLARTRNEAYLIYINPMHPSSVAEGGFHRLDKGHRSGEDWSTWYRPGAAKRDVVRSAPVARAA